MWRHGVIHTYRPKVVANAARQLGWLSYPGVRTGARVELLAGDEMTVWHLTPHRAAGTLDHFPVANNCLVGDLDRVLELIACDLEAEQGAGGTTLLVNMRDATMGEGLTRPQPCPRILAVTACRKNPRPNPTSRNGRKRGQTWAVSVRLAGPTGLPGMPSDPYQLKGGESNHVGRTICQRPLS
jgi:hypothetical protein